MRGINVLLGAAMCTAVISASSCGIVGPSCVDRQKTGLVTAVSGRAEAGRVTTHVLAYDRQGSQNDVKITWAGQGQAGAPRLRIYATGTTCTEFGPPGTGDRASLGECALIASGGGFLAPDVRECARSGACAPTGDEIIHTSLIVTGPGNGAPHDFREYLLHVLGDPRQAVDYTVVVTWFHGPDC
jgi:hypothetical protein